MHWSHRFVPTLWMVILATPGLADSSPGSGSFDPKSIFSPPAATDFSFADQLPLELTLAAPRQSIRVLNQTTEVMELRVVLDGPVPKVEGSTGRPEPWPAAVAFRSDALRTDASDFDVLILPAAGSAEVEVYLTDPNANVEPGDYRGYLVFYRPTADETARKEIKLSVVAEAPVPLVKKWEIRYWRTFPFSTKIKTRNHDRAYIPLKGRKGGPALSEPCDTETETQEPFGYLKSEDRDQAVVYRIPSDQELEGGLGEAVLDLRGTDRYTSKYEGTIDFQPGTEGVGEVELTVTIKDHWLLAVLCLLFGILLTRLIQSFLEVGRPIWIARARTAQLGIDFETAHAVFQKKDEGRVYADFSIAADLKAQQREVRNTLDRLQRSSPEDLETDDAFKAVQQKLQRLEAAVAAWPAFHDQLTALDEARVSLEGIVAGLEAPPMVAGKPPNCLQHARELVEPGMLSIDEYEKRERGVAATTTVLRAWQEIEERVQVQRDAAAELDAAVPQDHPDRQAFDVVEGEVLKVWDRLWRLKTGEELARQAEALDASRDQLARLSGYLKDPRGLRSLGWHRAREIFAGHRELTVAVAGRAEEMPDDREILAYYSSRRRIYEAVAFGTALALAVYTGLGQLYQGHDFVTPYHYLGALLWGAGSKLAIDTVAAGIGHLPSLWKAIGRIGRSG